jgi:hypothetical protein
MNEQWVKWEPIKGLSAKYYVESISDGIEEFKIVLVEAYNKKNKVQITIPDSIYAYRSTYESFRLDTLYSIDKQYETKFYSEWTFFKVTNSSYLKWLSEQSYEITDNLHLIHFSILALDSVVDFVDVCDPKVELIMSKE